MSEIFDFEGVEAAKEGVKYLTPGMYMIKPLEAVYGVSPAKQTAYMDITFQTSSKNPDYEGKTFKSRFFLTVNSMPRLVYFHEAFYGKKITKKFTSAEDIVTYFNAIFKSEAGSKIKKPAVVGGSISKGNVYCELPFTGYVLSEKDYEEGAFEINSDEFKRVISSQEKELVKSDKPKDDSDFLSPEKKSDTSDDLPF